MAIGFRVMLVTTDDEPVDPGVVLCAESRSSGGDVFTLGPDPGCTNAILLQIWIVGTV